MWDFIFSSVWGWIGTAGVIVAACVAVGWYVKPWRPYLIAIGAGAIYAASVYTKGSRDQAAREKRQREAAVKKVNDEYEKIDAAPHTVDGVSDKLRRGKF